MPPSIPSYLTSLFSLQSRLAVVTGSTSGIGLSIARALGHAGATTILIARRPAPLTSTVATLRAEGVAAHGIAADVRSADDIAERILREHGVPDILVNAAGVNPRPHMNDLSLEQWEETLAINLTAPFKLGQKFGPLMAERGSGRIINIASQQSFRAFGNSGAYGASKGGLVSLTRSQAEAWGPKGVLCNAIVPGLVATPMTEAVLSDPAKARMHEERTMIKRNGTPEDFEGIAVYLASDASKAVTGQVFFIDGGYSAT